MQPGQERRAGGQFARKGQGSLSGSLDTDRRFPCGVVIRLSNHFSINSLLSHNSGLGALLLP